MKLFSSLLLASIVAIDTSNSQAHPNDISSKQNGDSKDIIRATVDKLKTNLRSAEMNELTCVEKGQSNPDCAYNCCEGLTCRTPDGFDDSFKACQRVVGRKGPTASVVAAPIIVD